MRSFAQGLGPNHLWAWLFLSVGVSAGLRAQVVVRNGLSHVHAWTSNPSGTIDLKNSSDQPVTAYVTADSLWGPQNALQIPSQVSLDANESRSVPYRWLNDDSVSQATRIYITTDQPTLEASPKQALTLRISTRYAVDLYRGPVGTELDLEWVDGGVKVQNSSTSFWAGACYELRDFERFGNRLAGGVLRPGDHRIWRIPPGAQGVWIETSQGSVLASLRP
jgi:hypothetical protein